MKERVESRLREYIKDDGSIILDIGGLLIHVPSSLDGEREHSTKCFLCSIEEGVTRTGRKILRLRPVQAGSQYYVVWHWGAGDKGWDGWNRWPDHPEIKTWAGANSRGGGCWWEVWVFPSRFGRTWRGTWRPDPDKIRVEELEKELR